jgi:lipoprotein-anchoring transpeptidase ErfK/SrfK
MEAMPLRRKSLLGFAAAAALSLAFAAPAHAEGKSLREIFFPKKVEKTDDTQKPAKKLTAKEKAKLEKLARQQAKDTKVRKPDGPVPGVDMAVRDKTEQNAMTSDVATVAATGNNGELRSEGTKPQKVGLFGALFGAKPRQAQLLPQTRALDTVLAAKESRKKFKVKDAFLPQEVDFSGYPTGTIVIDTKSRFLYLVESRSTARRYAIAVGREGLLFTGSATVGDKQEWPRWIPTLDMQKREPKHYGQYKDGMPGGPENPLGARAIYLYQGKRDTHIRIHGTNQPQSIGSAASNGCFRMVNEHVMDLYGRVRLGTPVVVL